MTELKGIHIVDDTQDAVVNLTIEDGIIQSIEYLDAKPDASQPVVMPAFTDLHVHFRDPGLTYKEDVVSGSRAAVRGGYTAVNMMPNTVPVVDVMLMVHMSLAADAASISDSHCDSVLELPSWTREPPMTIFAGVFPLAGV